MHVPGFPDIATLSRRLKPQARRKELKSYYDTALLGRASAGNDACEIHKHFAQPGHCINDLEIILVEKAVSEISFLAFKFYLCPHFFAPRRYLVAFSCWLLVWPFHLAVLAASFGLPTIVLFVLDPSRCLWGDIVGLSCLCLPSGRDLKRVGLSV